jgi:hypothetical protein
MIALARPDRRRWGDLVVGDPRLAQLRLAVTAAPVPDRMPHYWLRWRRHADQIDDIVADESDRDIVHYVLAGAYQDACLCPRRYRSEAI